MIKCCVCKIVLPKVFQFCVMYSKSTVHINRHHFLFLLIFFLSSVTATAGQKIPFQWISCGNSSDVITVQTLKAYQNDSDEIFVTGKGKVKSGIESPISAKTEIKKHFIGMWITVPCVDNFGTCSYPDICSLSPYKTDCPKILKDNNLPCNCPIHEGTYSFDSLPIDLNILPRWIEKGLYSIRVVLTSAGKRMLCLKMIIDL